MTNSFRNYLDRVVSKIKQRGAATLVGAIVLVLTATLIVMFAANNSRMQSDISGNINRNSQAYTAAEAGLGYGINYLLQNSSTITASPSGGYINYTNGSITNVALANGSKYSLVYTNPIANNYNIITITSTGASDDGSSTRTVQVQVSKGSIVSNVDPLPLVSKGAINLSGNGHITNTVNGNTVKSGLGVGFSGNAVTTIASGNSSSASLGIHSDVSANNTTLNNTSQNDLFASYFGTTSSSAVQAKMAHTYSNSSNTNYSSTLSGMTGTSIWIDQTGGTTASISGNTTIGSAANPVVMVVNGSFSVSGNVTIYGLIYVIGSSGMTTTFSGNLGIVGAVVTTDTLNISGNTSVTYNASVISNLKNNSSFTYWARIPGSWKDF